MSVVSMLPDNAYAVEFFEHFREEGIGEIAHSAFGITFTTIKNEDRTAWLVELLIDPVTIGEVSSC